MNIVIPKANTHSDVAKEQHLVQRTYMRQWSYNNTDSIYIFNKRQKEKEYFMSHSMSIYLFVAKLAQNTTHVHRLKYRLHRDLFTTV